MDTAAGSHALAGRRVVLGVSGGIAAYKAVEVCRRLVDAGAHVVPVLTADATRFVGALTFSALASEPARTSLFPPGVSPEMAGGPGVSPEMAGGPGMSPEMAGGPGVSPEMAGGREHPETVPDPLPHIRLGQSADLVVVAPATAKLIGKYAAGISDDLLTATLLASRAPVLLAPAMHTEMWEHPAVQENLAVLRRRGVHVVDPESGRLAGGDVGEGRLAEPARIVEAAARLLTSRSDLDGRRVLVTAGGTREPIDPVRFIGNRSSGKMGYALAEVAARRGASVTLVTTVSRPPPSGVEAVRVETAAEMAEAVLSRFEAVDAVVMAAAVADFRPKAAAPEKLKKTEGVPEVILEPTVDILAALGAAKSRQFLVGFAAETVSSGDTPYPGRLVEQATAKLAAKRVDLMVGNDVTAPDSGFEVDTNRAVLITPGGAAEELPRMTKTELAEAIWDRVAAALPGPGAPPKQPGPGVPSKQPGPGVPPEQPEAM